MTELIYELLLVMLLATSIGWFLGRYLCKSGEYAERARRQEQDRQIMALQSQIQQQDKIITSARQQLHQQEAINAGHEQKKEGLQAQIGSLQQERDGLLLKLQELEVTQSRLMTASQEIELLGKQVTELKAIRYSQTEQIETAQENLGQLQEQVLQGKKQNQFLSDALNESRAEQALQKQQIEQLQKDRELLAQTRLSLDEARSRLSLVEDDKKMLHERFTSLNDEHQQLRLQCQSMRQDSLQYNNRFSLLIQEKESLSQEIEKLNIEKHDYLGRLRAISSVVDMIGTEQA